MAKSKRWRVQHAVIGIFFALVLEAGLSLPAFAEEVHHFDVDTTDAAVAIHQFGSQSGVQILASAEALSGKQLNRISGELSTDDGLKRLLAGTGISHRYVSERAVALVSETAAAQTSSEHQNGSRVGPEVRLAQSDSTESQIESENQTSTENSKNTSPASDDAGDDKLEEVVVTGTNIRGAGPTGSPRQVYFREDIERSGRVSVESFFRTLPANVSNVGTNTLGLPSDNTSSNSGFGSAINLRGLGTDSALVLLNGNRIAPGGFGGSFVDTSFIPLSLIERVEILTDGASAIYGSDAVAGVVNFVLREDFEGLETTVSASSAADYEQYSLSQAAGLTWTSGSAALALNHSRNSNLSSRDRAFSTASELFDLAPEATQNVVFGTASQRLNDRVELGGTILFSDRDVEHVATDLGVPNLTDSATDQRFANLQADLAIGETWQARINASHAKNNTRLENSNGTTDATASSSSLRINLDGHLLRLPAGDLRLAIGAEYRQELFERLATGLFDFNAAIDRDRELTAVYGELLVPLVGENASIPGIRRLTLSAAARYENYSDFGDTTNPKLGLEWIITEGLLVRGSIGTSFKAPHLSDLYGGTTSILLNAPDPLGPGGESPTLIVTGANQDLEPETSTAWTIGVDWNPPGISNLRIGASYFEITYEDRIAAPANTNLFGFVSQPELYAPFILRSPTNSVIDSFFSGSAFFNVTEFPGFGPVRALTDVTVIGDQRLTNLAGTDVRGVDFNVNYRYSAGQYELDFGVLGTYLFEKQTTLLSGLDPTVEVDTLFNPPDLRFIASTFVTRGPLSAGVNVNYVDSYTNTASAAPEEIDSWTTADLQVRYEFGGSSRPTYIALNVLNVFDASPPDVSTTGLGVAERGYDPVNATPFGRIISLQLSTRW